MTTRAELTCRYRERALDLREATGPNEPWVVITPSPTVWRRQTNRSRSKSLFTSSETPELSSIADERNAKPKESASLRVNVGRSGSFSHSSSPFSSGSKKNGAKCEEASSSGRRTRSNSLTMEFIEESGSGKHTNKLSPSSKMIKDRSGTAFTDSESGTTSLHQMFSSSESNPSVEMLRIASSTNPLELRLKDKNGNLPLHIAVDKDDPSPVIVRELLNLFPGAAKVKDRMGNLPLFLACRRKRVQTSVIKAILKAHPEAATVKIMGALALHHLLHTGSPSPESAQLLIDAHPEGPRVANAYGNLPLHYLCALETPHISTVRVLMSAYPQAVQMKNSRGETPITRALVGCAIKRLESQDEYEADGTGPGIDQELSEDGDPALRRERVRLLLRISDPNELSDDQKVLLRELNYEAHRTALLCFVSLCKKYGTQPAIAEPAPLRDSEGAATADDSDEEDQEGAEDSNDDSRRVSAEFRMAICNGDVWRTITSYT